MKNIGLVLFISLLVGCQNETTTSEEITEPAVEQKSSDLIIGDWSMDSSVFINTGVRGEISPPLMTTTWTFGDDNSYQVKKFNCYGRNIYKNR